MIKAREIYGASIRCWKCHSELSYPCEISGFALRTTTWGTMSTDTSCAPSAQFESRSHLTLTLSDSFYDAEILD